MPQLMDLNFDTLATLVSYLPKGDLLRLSLTASGLREISQDRLICSVCLSKVDSIASFSEFILADARRRLPLLRSFRLERLNWNTNRERLQEVLETRLAPVLASAANLSSLVFLDARLGTGALDSYPRLKDALRLSLRRVADLHLSGEVLLLSLRNTFAAPDGFAPLRSLTLRLVERRETTNIMFLLECCKDTLELLEVINMEMAIQHLRFPPRVQWQRLSVLRLPGFPMALDARDLQAAFPNLQHLSMPSPRMRIDGYRPQQGTDAGAWTALSSYTGHLGYLLALGGGCRVSRLFPCEEFSQWEEWAFAPALRAARPRYIALSLQDHRFAPLCEPALWAAAPELEYMALDFGNSGNPAELNGALAGLCIALRGTQITYMSLRFPSPTYHTNDDLLHSVMTSIRYAVGMGLSSLRYVEVDIHYGHHQVQGVHQLLAIRPPGGVATGVRTRDDIVFESLDVSRARSLKEVLAR